MKLNEVLLIAGSLLAALVLSKGGSVSSIFKKSPVPFMPLENKTISFIENFPQLETFKQFFPVKETNVQLKNIMNIEEKENMQRNTYLQNEMDKVQQYIGSKESEIANYQNQLGKSRLDQFDKIAPSNWGGINLLRKFDKYGDPNRSLFPDFRLLYTQENRNIILQQANYENQQNNIQSNIGILETNIGKANEYAKRQQSDIDNLNEEYQTRFGSLSRYG
jgi:predicted nuclease with TOPRIM domain